MKLQPKDLVKLIIKKYELENPLDPTEEEIYDRLRRGRRIDYDAEQEVLLKGFIEYCDKYRKLRESRQKMEGSFREDQIPSQQS
jgi:hypothetical protein